jgi:hypothetical protein
MGLVWLKETFNSHHSAVTSGQQLRFRGMAQRNKLLSIVSSIFYFMACHIVTVDHLFILCFSFKTQRFRDFRSLHSTVYLTV